MIPWVSTSRKLFFQASREMTYVLFVTTRHSLVLRIVVVGDGDGLTGGGVMLPHQSAAPVWLIAQRPAAAGGTHQLARHVIA